MNVVECDGMCIGENKEEKRYKTKSYNNTYNIQLCWLMRNVMRGEAKSERDNLKRCEGMRED
jgi:hypothetical protein